MCSSDSKLTVLITGASGFVGSHLSDVLVDENLILVSRSSCGARNNIVSIELTADGDYSNILRDVDVVIHLAARVHQLNVKDKRVEADQQLRENYLVTSNLVQQAKKYGVKRFIFMSSIKVCGERTFGNPFNEKTVCRPVCSYGHSKLSAERKIIETCEGSNTDYVIVRPPMVYGDKYKGNLVRLIKAILHRMPLPFGGIDNRRSIISVRNLCDFIRVCVRSEHAKNRIFTVADEELISTLSLVQIIAQASSTNVKIFPVNRVLVSFVLGILRKSDLFVRLYTDLEVDASHARTVLGWKQPYSQIDELTKYVKDLLYPKDDGL